MSTWYERNKEEQLRRNKEARDKDPERVRKWARDSYHRRKNDPDKLVGFLLKDAKEERLRERQRTNYQSISKCYEVGLYTEGETRFR